jgi:hypothetical protein
MNDTHLRVQVGQTVQRQTAQQSARRPAAAPRHRCLCTPDGPASYHPPSRRTLSRVPCRPCSIPAKAQC